MRRTGSCTHRSIGNEASQLGLKTTHGPSGVAAKAQVRVPLRGAPDKQRQRLRHRERRPDTGCDPPPARAFSVRTPSPALLQGRGGCS